MNGFDFAVLERRIAALEAALPASLRFGRVVTVENGRVRVQFGDGQGMTSHWLPTLQPRVLKDQSVTMPDIGEPVACLFSGQGREAGVVLGAYYNARESAPGRPQSDDYRRYSDGTEIWYDREQHKLVANVQGDVEVQVQGTVSVASADEITLKAPRITLAGFLSVTGWNGGPGQGTLCGDYRIEKGRLDVPDGDVTAGGVSTRRHTHNGVEPGPGVTGKPVGGQE